MSSLDGIKHIILILSGKGGVGKSSVTTQLALALALANPTAKIGILDVDLTGPNIPRMFGIETSKIHQSPGGWIPVSTPSSSSLQHGTIKCMSIGFLLRDRGDSIVWRGPKKTAMVRQFLTDVLWGELDYLLIDTPPGTSDEHISLAETLKNKREPTGAVIVTTPQAVATADVRKELNFCIKVGINVLGVIENMSGYICPHCSECTNIFSSDGGRLMAQEYGVHFFGTVPIDPSFNLMIESQSKPTIRQEGNEPSIPEDNQTLLDNYSSSRLYPVFSHICSQLKTKIEHADKIRKDATTNTDGKQD